MNRKRKIRGIFVIKLLFFLLVVGTAQEPPKRSGKERKQIAREQIKKLKEGILVVRLSSNHRKIAALQSLLDGGALSKKDQQRIENQLRTTLENTHKANARMITAFKTYYDFSEAFFMLDTSSQVLKKGKQKGIFLNDSLEVDSTLSLNNRDFHVARFGNLDQANSTGFKAMILMDKNFKDLQGPFPFYVRINNFGSVIGSIFPKPKQAQRNANKIVKKLNKNLKSFYHQFHNN